MLHFQGSSNTSILNLKAKEGSGGEITLTQGDSFIFPLPKECNLYYHDLALPLSPCIYKSYSHN